MKKRKFVLGMVLTLALGGASVSCQNETTGDDPIDVPSGLIDNDPTLDEVPTVADDDLYQNNFGEDRIPNQWENYGVGDPFVYRWNGTYYLYVSTKDGNLGVKAWKSHDLINWTPCTGEGLEEGYVSQDPTTVTAYAPEVFYKNGKFYMIQSPAGSGHYIYESDSPEGPFVKISNQLDTSIDGSFFYGNDENVYLLKASNQGIVGNQLTDDLTETGSNNVRFSNTSLGSWTEGPYLLSRDGIYYMTFTGVHVVSPAYRVSYAYSTQEDFYNGNAFTFGDNIILNTSDDYQGLGHSSTVLGPNMDSYYIAYHNLISSGGPIRGFNIARLEFNGTEMTVNHPELNSNIAPELATFNSYDGVENFETGEKFMLSNSASGDAFTVEWNITGTGAELVFSYVDDSNYAYATIDNNIITINQVTNGETKEVTKYTLTKQYDYTKLHTLRLSYKDNQFDINFDSMSLVNDFNATFVAGKVGYNKADTFTTGYIGFSNYAEGSSENSSIKQDKIIASGYSLEKSKLGEGSGLVKIEEGTAPDPDYSLNSVVGANYMHLANELDRATYQVYFESESVKSVDVRVPSEMLGKKIGVKVNNGDIYEYTLPSYEATASDYLLTLGNIKVNKGVNNISFYNVGDDVKFMDAEFNDTTDVQMEYFNDLSAYVEDGVTYVNVWKVKNGGHYALAGTRQLVYFGDDTIQDVDVEVTLNFDGGTLSNTAGLILAGDNAAFSIHDNANSIQGYYCAVNNSDIILYDSNYNKTVTAGTNFVSDDSLDSGKDITLRAVKEGKNIKFYVNGELKIEYTSPLGQTQGYVGLYTNGAAVTFKNLKIKTL